MVRTGVDVTYMVEYEISGNDYNLITIGSQIEIDNIYCKTLSLFCQHDNTIPLDFTLLIMMNQIIVYRVLFFRSEEIFRNYFRLNKTVLFLPSFVCSNFTALI